MKEIQLTQGQVALVDDEDFERVSQFKWHAHFNRTYANGGAFLASRTVGARGNRSTVYLHRLIIEAGTGQIIDHIDGNPLNNQRHNLRIATRSVNGANTSQILLTRNRSGFRGVSFYTPYSKWRAQIKATNRTVTLGYFTDKLEAAKAYNEAAKKYHGEFATLNPIEGE